MGGGASFIRGCAMASNHVKSKNLTHNRRTAPPEKLTMQQREMIVSMLCRGYTAAETAAAVVINRGDEDRDAAARAVEKVLKEPATLDAMQTAAWDMVRAALPRAVARVSGQIDNDNDWVAINAARVIFDLLSRANESTEAAPVVSFGAMPPPGMPSTSEK